MRKQLSLLDLPPQTEAEPLVGVTVTDYGIMPDPPAPQADCQFAPGEVVAVAKLTNDETMFYGSVVAPAKVDGMVLVNIGIPSNPYCCSEGRLTRYDGVVALWRLGEATICDRPDCQPKQNAKPFACPQCEARSQPHWWYVGEMSTEPSTPRWPDAVWFPANYDPNTRSFGE